MKKAILFTGVLFFLLMTMSSYAQKNSKEKTESKSKTEQLQNNNRKENKMVVKDTYKNKENLTSKNSSTKVEQKGVSAPDHWHKPNSKAMITIVSKKLKFKNNIFQVKHSQNGFDIYENGSSTAYAKLVPTPKEGLYRYNSSTVNGAAHFDAKGNLILKYLDSDTGKMKEIQFQSN